MHFINLSAIFNLQIKKGIAFHKKCTSNTFFMKRYISSKYVTKRNPSLL
ncbi:protein of unknown function (plasmid) [Listeria monocytogenes R479a]|uniref:Uncharacterized protein n=1 Tax=Listeria monocytogenes TaxID=1639 RepID=A0A142ECA5_LISMN|nr:hypothetical protein pA144_0048 [Listeria monocytogenes]CDM15181.1 protein of unknown function [Listeria monocytogenes R479a]CUL76536.1 hypothetical protein LM801457_50050 [Listeria monocytogenes]